MIEPVAKMIAIIVGTSSIAAGAYAVGDYTGVRPVIKKEFMTIAEQMEQTSQSVLLLQFQLLMQKRQYGGLTFAEQQQLCQIAAALQYVGVPGC